MSNTFRAKVTIVVVTLAALTFLFRWAEHALTLNNTLILLISLIVIMSLIEIVLRHRL
jgi:hypothetical protein